VSVQAITWVLEEAVDVRPHLVATLIGLANHADGDGRGAYPSQATLARYTRKTPRGVRNDLAQLEADGLIARGNQKLVQHIAADERPIVWDLRLDRKCASARTGSGNDDRGSTEKSQVSATDDSTGEGLARNHGSARKPTSGRKSSVRGTGSGLPEGPEVGFLQTVLEPSTKPSSSGARDGTVRFVVDRLGCDDDDARWIVDQVQARHAPRRIAGYVRGMSHEDLATLLAERHPPPRPEPEPACGQCGPNRLVERDNPNRLVRCPNCHPLREERVA